MLSVSITAAAFFSLRNEMCHWTVFNQSRFLCYWSLDWYSVQEKLSVMPVP